MQTVNPRIQQGGWQPGDVSGSSASLFVQTGYPLPERSEAIITTMVFGLLLAFHVWGMSVGWTSLNLPGNEFRQTQTAMTALFVQREHNFSLAYPTPVLGKPWSIPFEFPLYQWSVVWLSDATGMPLTQAGRAVSAVCCYLALPAVWLLLRRLGLSGSRRLIVLGMVLSCPLYIFYARAFLIETMALMFSLWFLYAWVTAVERRNRGWLILANVAGMGAGLVKVTTLMLYLIPAGAWALWWLWRGRPWAKHPHESWLALTRRAGWIAAATVVPFAASYGWMKFADAVKALNVSSRDLVSSAMSPYNFGTWQTRFAPETWDAHWRILFNDLTSVTVLAICGALALLFARRWWPQILACIFLFLVVQLMFPVLYAWHEYYYVANAVLLMAAMGLTLCALLESPAPRWAVWMIILGVYGGQLHHYLANHYAEQRNLSPGGSDLTQVLRDLTRRDDVIIVAGEDWGSMTPYFSQRRALMIRRAKEHDGSYLRAAFQALKDQSVAALVLRGEQRGNAALREMATQHFGINPDPAFGWHDAVVYMQKDLHAMVAGELARSNVPDLINMVSNQSQGSIGIRHEVPVASLPPRMKRFFIDISPEPDRYYSTFGIDASSEDGRWFFSAHPDTRLWFKMNAGKHQIYAEYRIAAGAYEGLPREDATDGVGFIIQELLPGGTRQTLFNRLLNPRDNLADRGMQKVYLDVDLAAGAELLFETTPGPGTNYNRDWAAWGRIQIK